MPTRERCDDRELYGKLRNKLDTGLHLMKEKKTTVAWIVGALVIGIDREIVSSGVPHS